MADQVAMVAQALQATTSPTDEVRKPAEDALTQAGNTPGFLGVLLAIIANTTCEPDLRLSAIICLKRTLHRHWKPRKAGVYTISDGEKESLKQFLLRHMEEPNQRVAVQLAVATADIARREWPGSWDQLFHSLMGTIHSGSDLAITRAVYTLHRVLKELSTKRLLRDREAFARISVQLFPVVSSVWLERSQQLLQTLGPWGGGSTGDLAATAALEASAEPLAHLVVVLVKCLFRIVLSGFPNSMLPDAGGIPPADVAFLFQNLLQHENALVMLATSRATAELGQQPAQPPPQPGGDGAATTRQLPGMLSKLLYRMTLIPVHAQKQSPLPFRPFLRPFLDAFYDQLGGLFGRLPPPPRVGGAEDSVGATGGGSGGDGGLVVESTYPATPATSPPSFERLGINALTFLTNVLSCEEYKLESAPYLTTSQSSRTLSATGDQEMSAQAIAEASGAVLDFFNPERAQTLLDLAMHRILPLRAHDLEEWGEDAEAFHLTSVSLTPEESPRAAAEVFLVSLLERLPDSLVPLLGVLLQDSAGQAAAAAAEAAAAAAAAAAAVAGQAEGAGADVAAGSGLPSDVLVWEARYLTAGLAASALREAVDYNTWFLSTLAPGLTALVQGGGGGAGAGGYLPVLRRRIMWLIGMWSSEVRDEMRPPLYQSLVQMLAATGAAAVGGGAPDAAVSLTLLKTLGKSVDSWDFNVDAFRPLTGDAVGGLYCILGAFTELDSRLQVMNLIHLILRTVGNDGVRSCVEAVVAPLGQIWQGASGDDVCLLRKCVLSILTVVVGAVGSADAARLNPLVMPMLLVATDLRVPESDVLLEDGLELWSAALAQAPEYSAELHALFPHLPPLLARDLEHLQVAMKLVGQYVVLGAAAFLEAHGGAVTQVFNSTVLEVSARGARCVAEALDNVLVRYPGEGADMLRQGGVLTKLLVFVVESDADDRGGAAGAGGGGIGGAPSLNDDTTMCLYLSLLARVMFTAPEQMRALLHTPGVTDASPAQVQARVLQLVDLWLKKFDSLGASSSSGPWRRKAVALALISLLPADPAVLQRVDLILNVSIDVLAELREGPTSSVAAGGSSPAKGAAPPGVFDGASEAEFAFGQDQVGSAPASDRYTTNLRAMLQGDSVQTTDLAAFLNQKLAEAQASVGAPAFQQVLAGLDPTILQQLQVTATPGV